VVRGDGRSSQLRRTIAVAEGRVLRPERAASGYGGRRLQCKLWDLDSGQNVLILRGHTGLLTCLSFSRDGTRLASGGWDKTIRIWEAPQSDGTSASSVSSFASQPEDRNDRP